MSQNTPQRLYLMQVGLMPDYGIPIVCYLVQTGDGQNILIDSGLPEIMPEGETDFANGQDVNLFAGRLDFSSRGVRAEHNGQKQDDDQPDLHGKKVRQYDTPGKE